MRSMRETEYRRLRAKLVADHQKDLESLDRVFRMSGGDPQAFAKAEARKGKQETKNGRVDRGALSGAIDEVLLLPKFAHGDFTAAQVYAEIKQRHPEMDFKESSVSSAVVRLAGADGPLTLVIQGKGRRPSHFKSRQ